MSLYKPKNSPYWHFDFQLKGVRFHGSTGTANKSAAVQIMARERTEAAVTGGRKRKPMTLTAATGRYWSEIAEFQPSHATTDYQLINLNNGLGKDTLLSDITDNEIAEYVARRRADVSNASVNREVQLLKRVLRRARLWKVDLGDVPNWRDHMVTEPAGRVRELTDDEEARLFEALREDYHPLVEFALTTGVRLGNCLNMTWEQVDYGTMQIKFRTKSKRPGGEVHFVPITDAMLTLLARQRGHHPEYVFTFVCERSRGDRRKGIRYPFSQGGWRRPWKRALEAAGIEDFRFHDTRHTAGTRMLRVTGNLKVVQVLLGHADIASTARYAHADIGDVRAAMERVQSRNTPEAANTGSANPLNRRA